MPDPTPNKFSCHTLRIFIAFVSVAIVIHTASPIEEKLLPLNRFLCSFLKVHVVVSALKCYSLPGACWPGGWRKRVCALAVANELTRGRGYSPATASIEALSNMKKERLIGVRGLSPLENVIDRNLYVAVKRPYRYKDMSFSR